MILSGSRRYRHDDCHNRYDRLHLVSQHMVRATKVLPSVLLRLDNLNWLTYLSKEKL
jgi:hypothetical protein